MERGGTAPGRRGRMEEGGVVVHRRRAEGGRLSKVVCQSPARKWV
jgi:hypothetical protein